MRVPRAVCYFLCFVLLIGVVGGLAGDRVALAAEEKLELTCKYPVLPGRSGDSFEFALELIWHSGESRQFDITATGPPDWTISILGGYEKKKIGSRIGLTPVKPGETYPTEAVTVQFAPLPGELPEPGEYIVTLQASSGDIKETIELTAVVTTLHRFYFTTATERLSTEVTAGEENHLAVMVGNTGRGVIDEIEFLSSKPSGWRIKFNPEKVESLQPGLAREIDVTITPPSKTIAGDYLVTMNALSPGMPLRELELRVTVLTPTVWGWVAVLIVLAVIAGLGVMFRRLGRR